DAAPPEQVDFHEMNCARHQLVALRLIPLAVGASSLVGRTQQFQNGDEFTLLTVSNLKVRSAFDIQDRKQDPGWGLQNPRCSLRTRRRGPRHHCDICTAQEAARLLPYLMDVEVLLNLHKVPRHDLGIEDGPDLGDEAGMEISPGALLLQVGIHPRKW